MYTFNVGAKVAQIVFMKKEKEEFIKVDRLDQLGLTKRGGSGFGSSDSKKVKFEKEDEKDKVIVVEDASMSENGKTVVIEKSITIE